METISYISPIGIIEISGGNTYVSSVSVKDDGVLQFSENTDLHEINKCKQQLVEYFKGERKFFDINIKEKIGTAFQQKVWAELRNIPYGETATYGAIAKKIGNAKAARAVGMANNKNPILIITPCHRVIGTNGKMVGFGAGIWRKVFLINLERANQEKSFAS